MAKILIAGQDAAALEMLDAELTGEGHTVLTAFDGQEAYELALGEHPDVLFVEPVMAIYSGLELCEMLREDPDVPAALPVILLTSEEIDPRRIERSRLTAVLPKLHAAWELREMLYEYLSGNEMRIWGSGGDS